MDFTIQKYRELLEALLETGYAFLTANEYYSVPQDRRPEHLIILRHDVDMLPENSLTTAILEHTLGIRATYYFRIVNESNNPAIIQKIVTLGHEIGYHYEDLTTAQGDTQQAYSQFVGNLEYFKQFYPINTICMHGSPRSKYDSKDIWQHYDYHSLGIIAEPYLDSDFSRLFYLTDTGRRWDGFKVSVRDKIPYFQDIWTKQGLVYHSTDNIIEAAVHSRLPGQIMITTHPQRWTDNKCLWTKELILQTAKNIVKFIICNM